LNHTLDADPGARSGESAKGSDPVSAVGVADVVDVGLEVAPVVVGVGEGGSDFVSSAQPAASRRATAAKPAIQEPAAAKPTPVFSNQASGKDRSMRRSIARS